ncbi:hypothetical protein [Streptomyces sp. Inha503]|uniref:hypothetical protein n=1 Tax=Streptomyces sp. Inha503 TaxID=3383314 RepID=UPI0039A07787
MPRRLGDDGDGQLPLPVPQPMYLLLVLLGPAVGRGALPRAPDVGVTEPRVRLNGPREALEERGEGGGDLVEFFLRGEQVRGKS